MRKSTVVAIALVVVYLLNINRIYDYELGPVEIEDYRSTNPSDIWDSRSLSLESRPTIKNHVVSGNLSNDTISFNTLDINQPEDGGQITEEEYKRYFFFGKPVQPSQSNSDYSTPQVITDTWGNWNWTTQQPTSVGGDMDYSNSDNSQNNGTITTPIEVTYERFLSEN